MADRERKYGKIILESVMIIFSVLFALFINEWRSVVKENNRTEIILENIEAELLENQAIAKEFLEYHKTVRAKISEVYDKDSLEVYFYPEANFEFLKVAPYGVIQKEFKDIGWEVGKQERLATRIEFEKSVALFEAYTQQLIVYETINRIINLLSSREIQRKELLEESVILLGTEFQELIGQEGVLLRLYKKALATLED